MPDPKLCTADDPDCGCVRRTLAEVEEAVKADRGESYWYRIDRDNPTAPMIALVPLSDVLAAIARLQEKSA